MWISKHLLTNMSRPKHLSIFSCRNIGKENVHARNISVLFHLILTSRSTHCRSQMPVHEATMQGFPAMHWCSFSNSQVGCILCTLRPVIGIPASADLLVRQADNIRWYEQLFHLYCWHVRYAARRNTLTAKPWAVILCLSNCLNCRLAPWLHHWLIRWFNDCMPIYFV
jgi:hypothetical protein